MKRRLGLALGVLIIVCLVPLVMGVEAVLLLELPGGLPLGTLLAAVAMVSGAAIGLVASPPRSWLRWLRALACLAALLWLPLGIVLSGNPALRFVNDAFHAALFWRFTGLTAVLIILVLGASGVSAVLRDREQSGSAR
jgi:hypothetical protein